MSELFQTLFDFERMVYFVAPDWYRPKEPVVIKKRPKYNAAGEEIDYTNDTDWEDQIYSGQRSSQCDNVPNRGYYSITEDSNPAPRGASLGWCLQLDGDDQRNAFLNSPWIRVAIPVMPGMEYEALEWLKKHETTNARSTSSQTSELSETEIKNRLSELFPEPDSSSGSGENQGSSISETKIFMSEFGDDSEAFNPTGEKGEKVATWIEVVPTKQTVAVQVEYDKVNGQIVPRY